MLNFRIRSKVVAAAACALALAPFAQAQMFPVAATGWNRDVVIERTATPPYSNFALSFDTFNGWSWYENGLPASTKGLPQGGAFLSVVDGTTLGQLQPYDANNALFLDVNTTSGVLTLAPAAQVAYDTMAIFASSSNGGGTGTLVITFTDTSTSASIALNAQDWFNVTTNNALNNLGRGNLAGGTVDDASTGNPRIYQTTIDMVALGLNNRNVASIAFTKPVATGAQNTVIMGISGRRAVNQLFPLAATGWNRDIVVEASGTAPYSSFASSFDSANNLALYEVGLPGSTKGLPAGGAFNSASNSAIHAQLQPYNAPNALFLNTAITSASGTLALNAQVPYEFLAVFASSASGGGAGTMVINFTDSTTSGVIPFNAPDWFNTTTNNALINLGRSNLITNVVDDASADNPRIYQSVIDMAALGFNNRAVASITFTKPAASTSTAILAISGQPASSLPGACCGANGTCTLLSLANCVSPNLFQTPGTTCSGAGGSCPSAASACCNTTSGACVYINGTTCAAGFNNRGAGSACVPNLCPQTGACCANTGSCGLSNAAACASPSLFQGLGTTCMAGACPTAVGACCQSLFASCVFVAGSTCPSGYTFSGPGSVCSPNACVGLPSICENLDAVPVGSLPTNWTSVVATGVGAAWAVTNAQSHTTSNSVTTNDVASVSDQLLTLPAVTAGGNLTLDLWTNYLTEGTAAGGPWYDGWIVETSTDGGATFTNIGAAAWTLNGYNATAINATFLSPIAGQPAFCGAATTWTERTAVIPANSGDQVIIQFRMASDNSVSPANSGVWLDDICIANILVPSTGVCCRGATCNTTVTTAAACTGSLVGGQTAGAAFVSSSSTCNNAAVSNTPCCYADYNKTGGVSVQDIFDFLSDWFAGSAYANTGGTGAPGTLSVQNIFDFLSNWFNGGC